VDDRLAVWENEHTAIQIIIRRRNMPAPKSEEFEAHLQELLRPTVYSQLNSYRQLGLRERILSLPLMVAAVLTLLWRQVPSVHELGVIEGLLL
jgi:hypothetical protein